MSSFVGVTTFRTVGRYAVTGLYRSVDENFLDKCFATFTRALPRETMKIYGNVYQVRCSREIRYLARFVIIIIIIPKELVAIKNSQKY